jgi:hypothetical protein
MTAPDPFAPVPKGWTKHVEPASASGPEQPYIMHDEEAPGGVPALGELGMIAYNGDEVGGYWLPGASPACQGPYATLAEAVAFAERHHYTLKDEPAATVKVTTMECIVCRHGGVLEVPVEGWKRYRAGAFAQDAFGDKSAGWREQLITGTHPECWAKMMAGTA